MQLKACLPTSHSATIHAYMNPIHKHTSYMHFYLVLWSSCGDDIYQLLLQHRNIATAHCHDLRVRANVTATPAVKPNSKLHNDTVVDCCPPVFSAIICSSPVMHFRSCCIAANADAVAPGCESLFGDQNDGALPASDGRREPSVLEG